MLAEFGSWWAQQMLDLVPARLARPDQDSGNALIVAAWPVPGDALAATPALTLAVRRNRRNTELGRFALDAPGIAAARRAVDGSGRHATTLLRLPGAMLLERDVPLPLAAERDVERVLQYDMDRLTPFAAAEVFWTWSLLRRDRAQARLHIRVSLVPRAGLAALLATLGDIAVVPTALELPGADGQRRISLQHADPGRVRRRRQVVGVAAGGCAVLAAAALAIPFVRQSLAMDAVEQRIEALRPRVAEADALRRRIASETNGADALAAAKARTGDALQVLAALTDILPDDTSLTALTLRQRQMSMEGRSAAAVKLIAGLSADPVIRNPTFAAPVVRNEDNADIFSIRAELGP